MRHGGEAQARPALRREERLEDALPRLLVHPDPGRNGHHHSGRAGPAGRCRRRSRRRASRWSGGPPRGMASCALRARFRTSCSISVTSARTRPSPRPARISTLSPPRSPAAASVELRHHRVEIRGRGSVGAAATESEQLAVQRGGALGRVERRGEPGEGRVVGAELAPGELDLAGDHEQEVVEVVRRSRRQAPRASSRSERRGPSCSPWARRAPRAPRPARSGPAPRAPAEPRRARRRRHDVRPAIGAVPLARRHVQDGDAAVAAVSFSPAIAATGSTSPDDRPTTTRSAGHRARTAPARPSGRAGSGRGPASPSRW